MRGTVLVVSILVLVPVTGAWQLPEHPPIDSEWVVVDEDGWSHSEWVQLRNGGLEPCDKFRKQRCLCGGITGTTGWRLNPCYVGLLEMLTWLS